MSADAAAVHPAVTGLLLAVLLAAVHLLAGKVHFLGTVPRSRWLSFAGGVAIAYVLVEDLPAEGDSRFGPSRSAPAA